MVDEQQTTPKPYVFVLMPFDPTFDDIYMFGIKGSAQEAGAFADRVDKQIFTEGMLDRIFNQISKADVIVADMTGRNPNVFYEVGYAHALNKIVLLLTKDTADIPFDLKHRQHIVYGGSIEKLKRELTEKIRWAIAESKSRNEVTRQNTADGFIQLSLDEARIYPAPVGISGPRISKRRYDNDSGSIVLRIELRNISDFESPPLKSVHLFCNSDSFLKPIHPTSKEQDRFIEGDTLSEVDVSDGLTTRYTLEWKVPSLPSKTTYSARIAFESNPRVDFNDDIPLRIRLYYPNRYYDYPFVLLYRQEGRIVLQ